MDRPLSVGEDEDTGSSHRNGDIESRNTFGKLKSEIPKGYLEDNRILQFQISETGDKVVQSDNSYHHADPLLGLLDAESSQDEPPGRSNSESYKQEYPFTKLDLCAIIISVSFYLFDLISDVLLAIEYFKTRRLWEFGFTVSFIAIPSFVTSILSFLWYKQDTVKEKRTVLWYLRKLLFSTPPLAPVFRNLVYTYHGIRSRSKRLDKQKKKEHYDEMVYGDRDASMLRMIDAFMESAPQLVLQIYFTATEMDKDKYLQILRYVSILASWIGVSWSVASYYKALRISNAKAEFREGSIVAAVWYFVWRAFEVGPRVIAIGLTASLSLISISAVVAVHWIIMVVWIIFQNPDYYHDQRKQRWILITALGFAHIFSFMSVKTGTSRFNALIFYSIFYLENLIAVLIWLRFQDRLVNWMFYVGIAMVVGGFFMQILFQVSYYIICHPKRRQVTKCICFDT